MRASIPSTRPGAFARRRVGRTCAENSTNLQAAQKAPVAEETLQRIAALYAMEQEVRGHPPEERRQVRQPRAPDTASRRVAPNYVFAFLGKALMADRTGYRGRLGSDEMRVVQHSSATLRRLQGR